MEIIDSIDEMREYSSAQKKAGKTIALVPTMGALHEGHLSLTGVARGLCDITVVSVFVNPAQFGPSEDFAEYPRDLERDRALAEGAGCDCVFAPAAGEMYPDGYSAYVEVEGISSALCGAARPGHFRGVATVVLKLFNIVAPDAAVFGAKDAQQVAVIRRMAEDLNLPVRIVTAPTLREPDGLAMSSRNAYLTADERKQAASISGGLFEARRMFGAGERSVEKIRECALSIINGSGGLIRVEYVEVVGVENFQSLQNDIDTPALIAAACRTGESGTRMIDNVELKQ